jgi:type I restriction enzyme S subunit
VPVPLCSEKEQQEVVQRIERAFNWIDRLTSEATSARKLVDRLDQAVLAKAFHGKLVPQDPSDEPASVLLARIKADKAAGSDAKAKRKKRS